jgi:hypothetical protein
VTQPNVIVPPNPERAAWLRELEIPPNLLGWTAFRDFELAEAENGITQAQADNNMYMAHTIDKLVGAQLDTIFVLLNLQKGLRETGEAIQSFIYKKKDPAPADGATTDQ